jgi:hypothetical protein
MELGGARREHTRECEIHSLLGGRNLPDQCRRASEQLYSAYRGRQVAYRGRQVATRCRTVNADSESGGFVNMILLLQMPTLVTN